MRFDEAGTGATEYVSPRTRRLSSAEAEIRTIAYALREGQPRAVELAADAMAAFVPPRTTLVPVPSSSGDVSANLKLSKAIAKRTGSRVVVAIRRSRPVESSRLRRLAGGRSLRPAEHGFEKIVAVRGPVLFIDNVMTTGSTFEVMRQALGRGTGLAYAVVGRGSREPG